MNIDEFAALCGLTPHDVEALRTLNVITPDRLHDKTTKASWDYPDRLLWKAKYAAVLKGEYPTLDWRERVIGFPTSRLLADQKMKKFGKER